MSLSEHFRPPSSADAGDGLFARPKAKPQPINTSDGVITGLHGDAELVEFVKRRAAATRSGGGGDGATTATTPTRSSNVAVVEYGASWCAKCHEMFPAYLSLARKYPQHRYAVAHVDELSARARSGALFPVSGRGGSGDGSGSTTGLAVRFTPTFALYDGSGSGKQVDEVVGRDPQRLEDHLWLHTD
jgi:thioredoxin 1